MLGVSGCRRVAASSSALGRAPGRARALERAGARDSLVGGRGGRRRGRDTCGRATGNRRDPTESDEHDPLRAGASRLGPATRRAAVLDGFASYVGAEAREATDYIELDWSAEEWTRGAYAATFGVGGLTRFGEDLCRPIGPIHWACTDIAGVGHMH